MSNAIERLDALFHRRYGRDGDFAARGYPVTLLEAGYAVSGAWWLLQDALHANQASYQGRHAVVRLDLMLADTLLHPCDLANTDWAIRYGYTSMSAAARAFRSHFRVHLGDARMIGQLGRWLALEAREAQAGRGIQRKEEARRRLRAFREVVEGQAESKGRAALADLGVFTCADAGDRRPRYPAIGKEERVRLGLHE